MWIEKGLKILISGGFVKKNGDRFGRLYVINLLLRIQAVKKILAKLLGF
jgi:hypothetical protein